jgi:hypothetical protein
MPQLVNPKHEAFCKGIVDGLKVIDAYEIAGYTRSPSAASQLRARPEIGQRIQELLSEKQQARDDGSDDLDNLPSELNRDWLIRTLMKNVSLAQKAQQIAPANKAVEMLAELIGYSFKKPVAPPKEGDEDKESEPGVDVEKMANAFEKLGQMLPPGPSTPEPKK